MKFQSKIQSNLRRKITLKRKRTLLLVSSLLRLRLLLRRRKKRKQLHLNKQAQHLTVLKDQVLDERYRLKVRNSKLRFHFLFYHKI